MLTPGRRGVYEKVDYVVVERDGATEEIQLAEQPSATVDQILRTPQAIRQRDYGNGSDDENDDPGIPLMTMLPSPTIPMPAATGFPTVRLGNCG
jgi:hypothetical protein